MRGAPDTGSIKQECRVDTAPNGKFRGILTIPYEGTRHTEDFDTEEQAQAALDALVEAVLPKPKNGGVSTAQAKDFNDAINAKYADAA